MSGLPTTDDGAPVVHAHVTESRDGDALEVGDQFILLFHDRGIHAKVEYVETEQDHE